MRAPRLPDRTTPQQRERLREAVLCGSVVAGSGAVVLLTVAVSQGWVQSGTALVSGVTVFAAGSLVLGTVAFLGR